MFTRRPLIQQYILKEYLDSLCQFLKLANVTVISTLTWLNAKIAKANVMSQDNTAVSQGIQQTSAQWAEIIGQLLDRLTGKGASVTYTFDNLEIDIPRAQGPNGQNMGSAKWTINGKIVINAEAHNASEIRQKTSVSSAA